MVFKALVATIVSLACAVGQTSIAQTTSRSSTSPDWVLGGRTVLDYFFENRSSLSLLYSMGASTEGAFNELAVGPIRYQQGYISPSYEARFGQGWYLRPSVGLLLYGKNQLNLDYGLTFGHRGKIKRLELYLQGDARRYQGETRLTGLIGVVLPVALGETSVLRVGLYCAPYFSANDIKTNEQRRFFDGLDWNFNLSYIPTSVVMLTAGLGLSAQYYVVTLTPRSELDLHRWSANLTARFFIDQHYITDKILKFY